MSLSFAAEKVYPPQNEKIFKLSERLKYLYINVTRKHSKQPTIAYQSITKLALDQDYTTYHLQETKAYTTQSITYNLTAHVLSPRIFNYELKQSNSTTCWKL